MTTPRSMGRRTFLGLLSGLASALVVPVGAQARTMTAGLPASSTWPSAKAWNELRRVLGKRLIRPKQPWAGLAPGPIPSRLLNPWYLEEQPGATQSTGMHRAWTSTPSSYAVAARSVSDIVTGVDFARENNVRLVVKGTGHDYYGRSSGPRESLLIWTHHMRRITVHDAFVPRGAPSVRSPCPQ